MTKREFSLFEQELEALLKQFQPNLIGSNIEEVLNELKYSFKKLLIRYQLINPNNEITISKNALKSCRKHISELEYTSLDQEKILKKILIEVFSYSSVPILDFPLILSFLLKRNEIDIPQKTFESCVKYKETKVNKKEVISFDIDSVFKLIPSPKLIFLLQFKERYLKNSLATLPFKLPMIIPSITLPIISRKKEELELLKNFLNCLGLAAADYALKKITRSLTHNIDENPTITTNEEHEFIRELEKLGSIYIREVGHKYGDKIYLFMEKYNIGKNYYGRIMDTAAKGKGVIAHRLYGHHPIFDIPLDNPQYILQFYEHLFSDLFTKQGLPILPGEILEDLGLLKACDKLTRNWNFLNGFDILTATVSIFSAVPKFYKALKGSYTINSLEQLAREIGVGTIELAIAISSANPFLLIAATLELTSSLKGIFNKGDRVFFQNLKNSLSIHFSLTQITLDNIAKVFSLNTSIKELELNRNIHSLTNK